MFLGGLANVVVVILNRGFMPVRVDQVHGRERFSYEPIHSGTRLWFLGDCIRLGTAYASPGDLFSRFRLPWAAAIAHCCR